MIDQQILQTFITSIRNAIKNKSIDTSSAMKLIVISMEIIESFDVNNNDKKEYVIMAIQEIAKGEDMIIGTSDDTISPEVVKSLIIMINTNLLDEVVDIVCLASKGEFNVNKIKKTCFGCFSIVKNHIK
jgi:hypothetical protein